MESSHLSKELANWVQLFPLPLGCIPALSTPDPQSACSNGWEWGNTRLSPLCGMGSKSVRSQSLSIPSCSVPAPDMACFLAKLAVTNLRSPATSLTPPPLWRFLHVRRNFPVNPVHLITPPSLPRVEILSSLHYRKETFFSPLAFYLGIRRFFTFIF